MADQVPSKNGVAIRLPDERWAHIAEEHNELAGLRYEVLETVQAPSFIVRGKVGELLAVRASEDGKALVVVYRELNGDGFVITAFLTSRVESLRKREVVWP